MTSVPASERRMSPNQDTVGKNVLWGGRGENCVCMCKQLLCYLNMSYA
jgi:hypothetical protein